MDVHFIWSQRLGLISDVLQCIPLRYILYPVGLFENFCSRPLSWSHSLVDPWWMGEANSRKVATAQKNVPMREYRSRRLSISKEYPQPVWRPHLRSWTPRHRVPHDPQRRLCQSRIRPI